MGTVSAGPERVAGIALPVLWGSLAFVAGDAVAGALDGRSEAVRTVAGALGWVLWCAGLVATLVPRTTSLTAARFLVPAGLPVVAWAVWAAGDAGALEVVAVTAAAAAATLVLTPWIGHRFVNGSSYGDERRYPLRAPLPVLAGPLEVVWLAAVLGVTTGPLLLAAQQWVAGAAALLLGWPVAAGAVRAAHQLARRWVVLVPAGIVVHDPMVLVDTLLVQRADLARVGLAEVGTDATDLTLGAAGLAVEIELRDAVDVLPLAHQRGRRLGGAASDATVDTPLGRTLEVRKVMVTPTRPGALLHDAGTRRLPIG